MLDMVNEVAVTTGDDLTYLFLPLAHSFARMIAYYGLYVGSTTAFARSIDTLSQDIAATKPHVIPAVPRIYEKIYGRKITAKEIILGGGRGRGGKLAAVLTKYSPRNLSDPKSLAQQK